MILEIKSSINIDLQFEGLVFGPFLSNNFNFAILKVSEKLLNLIERLPSSLIGFNKTHEPSFSKQPKSSSIPAILRTFVRMSISGVCQTKSISLKKCL